MSVHLELELSRMPQSMKNHQSCARERHNSVVQALALDGSANFAAVTPNETQSFSIHSFDCEKIVQVVWKHVHEVEQRGHRAKHLIMGRDIYGPFLSHALRKAMSFGMPADFVSRSVAGDCRPDMMFAGMNVHLIPWMCGCVALPELSTMAQPGRLAGISPWSIATPLDEIVIPGEEVNVSSIPPEGQRVMEGLRAAMVRWLYRPANVLHIKIPGMEVKVG